MDIPTPQTDGTTAAMAELVKNLQASMQALNEKMQKDSQELVAKCNMVTPLGGDFRQYNETGYILQYIQRDKELRRAVVEFVKSEVDKRQSGKTTPATGT